MGADARVTAALASFFVAGGCGGLGLLGDLAGAGLFEAFLIRPEGAGAREDQAGILGGEGFGEEVHVVGLGGAEGIYQELGAFGFGVVFHALDVGGGFAGDLGALGVELCDLGFDLGDVELALGVDFGGLLFAVGLQAGGFDFGVAGDGF